MTLSDADDFSDACSSLGNRIIELLMSQDKGVAICVLPGVIAAIIKTLGIPREVVVAMIDSALDDMSERDVRRR